MISIDPLKVQLLFMSSEKGGFAARLHTMPVSEVFTNDQVNFKDLLKQIRL